MKTKMNAVERPILTMNLYGNRINYVKDPESNWKEFFQAKSISKALKGYCVRTDNLTSGVRKFFKGIDNGGNRVPASSYVNIDGLDEIMVNISDPRLMNTKFYLNWHEDIMKAEEKKEETHAETVDSLLKKWGITKVEPTLKSLYDNTIKATKGCGCGPTGCSPKSTSRELELEAKVRDLEKTIQTMKLTKEIDSINPAEADFERKWKVTMSMISEYCDNRISVLGTMEPKDVAAYRSHLWNDFILVEVDVKLGTTLRKDHKLTGKKYKVLIRERNLIDGFFAVVSNLLKFGKG
jgi:hypothetical protein